LNKEHGGKGCCLMTEIEDRGDVLAISSHVVRGAVGNRASVFALETLGHVVWAMPTIILPWHPGHGRSTRIDIPHEPFTKALEDLAAAPSAPEIKAVLTGYFASAAQVAATARLVDKLKQANPSLVYLCDPVIGDVGGLYVAQEIAEAIRDQLLPLASIATPNRYELAWFAGADLNTNAEIAEAALHLGPAKVLVTSAIALMAGSLGNLWITGDQAVLAEHRLIENPPNGLGDLLAAVFLSRLMAGEREEKALQMATSSVFEILARTMKRGSNELTLAKDSASLATPMAMVHMRKLLHPSKGRRA
jgi:pyridoxine kinase